MLSRAYVVVSFPELLLRVTMLRIYEIEAENRYSYLIIVKVLTHLRSLKYCKTVWKRKL